MQNSNKSVTINSRKFDGTIHKSWKMNFIDRKNSLLTFTGEFEKEVTHSHLGVIRRGTISHEFYWLDGWFNVFRFHEPEGSLRNFYCNINMPPKFADGVLDYVDLDIDILVWRDFSIEILDMGEFAVNSEKFNYPAEIKLKVRENFKNLMKLIEKREFPFNVEI